jgi:hypothetical protein
MPSASRDEMPEREVTPDYRPRMADWGGMTVAFETAPAGMDPGPMLEGLPNGQCQANHWGYLFKGHFSVAYHDGTTEEIRGGQAYHVRPGHSLTFLEESDALEFTRTDELEQTFEAVRRNAGASHGD